MGRVTSGTSNNSTVPPHPTHSKALAGITPREGFFFWRFAMPVLLGSHNMRFTRVHGDVVAGYGYCNDERAMFLWPVVKKSASGAFIVCDSAAWKYDPDLPRGEWLDREGNLIAGPLYLMAMANQAAKTMCMDGNKSTVIRIASIIAEGLPDLVRLPPDRREPEKKKPIGEATLLVDGKPVFGSEI
jgi:hypothetical protein